MRIHISIRSMAVTAGFTLLAMMNTAALASSNSRLTPCELQEAVQGPPTPPNPQSGVTTIDTVGQAYFCILDNYFNGPNLSSRALLVPAFAGLTEEMQRRRFDHPRAELSAFTGNKFRDWEAFSRIYARITANLPAATQQALAQAALQAMIDSLHDNHAAWRRSRTGSAQVGVTLSVFRGPPVAGVVDPVAEEPIFVTAVAKNSPAEQVGIRVGDEIIAVNDVPLYVNGKLSEGVLAWITQPDDASVLNFTLRRPATNATLAISLMPVRMPVGPGPSQVTLLAGNVAYAKLPGFDLTNVDAILQGVTALANSNQLRGLVLDLRENSGGLAAANSRLLGAFAHNIVTGYWCDAKDQCTATRPDASVPLLNLPLVALIDRTCVSACDVFSNAVRDANLGKLVGTRTGGMVSGPSYLYALNDGTMLFMPRFYQLGASRQNIDTIGVAPHVYAPVTALDLSTGSDPALAKALELLR